MLNLNRKEGQSIMIGEGDDMVEVVVRRVSPLLKGGYDVELGFNAPKYINIDRSEVRERRVQNIDEAFNGNRK